MFEDIRYFSYYWTIIGEYCPFLVCCVVVVGGFVFVFWLSVSSSSCE